MRKRITLVNLFIAILFLVLLLYLLLYSLTSHTNYPTPPEPPISSTTLDEILAAITRLDQKMDKIVQTNGPKRKFLAVIPGFGPNNQYLGTKESMFIAKSLGRTFVAPNYFIHDSAEINDKSLRPFNLTFELQPLNGYTPTVSMEEFTKECQGWVDYLVWMRNESEEWWRRIGIYLNGSGIKFRTNIPAPYVENYHPVLFSHEDIKNYFKKIEDSHCVMIAFPFRNLGESSFPEVSVIVPQYLVHAPGIKSIASSVLSEIHDKAKTREVMSLHWRYGEITCKIEPAILHEGYDFCWGTSIFYWATIENIVKSLKMEVSKFENLTGIFIATDVAVEAEIYNKFKKEITEKTGIVPFRASDLPIFKSIQDNYYISLVEQEICAISTVFVQSTGSTWSEYVFNFLKSSQKSTKVTSFDMLLDESNLPYTKRNCRNDKRPVSINGAVVVHSDADPPHLPYFC